MATVAHNFTHLDLTCHKGDELPDDHELVALAPHLFVQSDPEPEQQPSNVRIRGPLVNPPPKPKRAPRTRSQPAKPKPPSTKKSPTKEAP